MLLALLLGAGFTGLGYRLVDLQVLRHDELSLKAQRNTQRRVLLEPRRGDILDAKGNLLATSVFVKTVCADPALLGAHQAEVAHALAPLLQANESELCERMMPRLVQSPSGQAATNHYVVLKRKVPIETWRKVQAAMTNITFVPDEKLLTKQEKAFYDNLRKNAIYVEALEDQMRIYPNQALAAHVLGYVGIKKGAANGRVVLETRGMDGIEASFDSKLAGVRGWRLTETDSHRRELVALREQDVEAHDGYNVVLTIDSVIQHIVESALADGMEAHSPISITGIAMRPGTGEILAMATLPNFDPNKLDASTEDARRNRVIADVAEPGSTFKIVVVSGALNDGTVQLTDSFDCENGHFHFAGRVLHDDHPAGVIPVERIITKSSNIGAAKIGIKMGPARVYDYINSFGFGTRTGIPLQGEVPGIVRPLEKWFKVSIAQIPMGQGISVTRLQMITAMCAIANKGVLMAPMLVDRLEDRDHNVVAKYAPQRVRQVMTEPAAKLMVQALKTVTSPEGTAPKAALEHFTVAGKTGTAQKFEHGQLAHGKYFTSFIGFFPADNPEICISVTMDEPRHGYYGGQIAAPIFKQIAERAANYLNIRPEDGAAPVVSDSSTPALDSRSVKTAAARTPQPSTDKERLP
jgi:cell division protein FtsI/penicillin-binding protein 2